MNIRSVLISAAKIAALLLMIYAVADFVAGLWSCSSLNPDEYTSIESSSDGTIHLPDGSKYEPGSAGIIGGEDGPTMIWIWNPPEVIILSLMRIIGWVLIPFTLFFRFKSLYVRGAGVVIGVVLLSIPIAFYAIYLRDDFRMKKHMNDNFITLTAEESAARHLAFINGLTSLELTEHSVRPESRIGQTDGDTTFLKIVLCAADVEPVKNALESPRMTEAKTDKTLTAPPPDWWPKENVIAAVASSEYLLGEEPLNIVLARSGQETML